MLHGVIRQFYGDPTQRQEEERAFRRPQIRVERVVCVLVVQEVHVLERGKGQGEEGAACGADDVVDEAQGRMGGDADVARIVHGSEREVSGDGAKRCS